VARPSPPSWPPIALPCGRYARIQLGQLLELTPGLLRTGAVVARGVTEGDQPPVPAWSAARSPLPHVGEAEPGRDGDRDDLAQRFRRPDQGRASNARFHSGPSVRMSRASASSRSSTVRSSSDSSTAAGSSSVARDRDRDRERMACSTSSRRDAEFASIVVTATNPSRPYATNVARWLTKKLSTCVRGSSSGVWDAASPPTPRDARASTQKPAFPRSIRSAAWSGPPS
jgi:hypothetical protein